MEKSLEKPWILIRKGAEANLYLTEWHNEKVIIKKRVPKLYRVAELDKKLREYRTIHEAENLSMSRRLGVPTPIVLSMENSNIIMEFIDGKRVKEALERMNEENRKKICMQIGSQIGRLHRNNLIHGDLTSSNMIIVDGKKIFFIDFGLSFYSDEMEDMGVDLHLLKRALYSTHHNFAEECLTAVKSGYEEEVGNKIAEKVFKKAQQIERRGRYFVERIGG